MSAPLTTKKKILLGFGITAAALAAAAVHPNSAVVFSVIGGVIGGIVCRDVFVKKFKGPLLAFALGVTVSLAGLTLGTLGMQAAGHPITDKETHAIEDDLLKAGREAVLAGKPLPAPRSLSRPVRDFFWQKETSAVSVNLADPYRDGNVVGLTIETRGSTGDSSRRLTAWRNPQNGAWIPLPPQ